MGNKPAKDQLDDVLNKFVASSVSDQDQDLLFSIASIPQLTNQDICRSITPQFTKSLITDNPKHFAYLCRKLISYVYQVANSQKVDGISAQRVVVAMRILARILPFVLEAQDSSFIDHLFWANEPLNPIYSEVHSNEPLPTSRKPSSIFSSESSSKPSKPSFKPSEPSSKPSLQPSELSSKPSEPSSKPSEPSSKPSLQPSELSLKPSELSLKPSELSSEPSSDRFTDTSSEKFREKKEESEENETQTETSLSPLQPSHRLAAALLSSLANLLFKPGFTVSVALAKPASATQGFLIPLDYLWAPGLGSPPSVAASTPTINFHRVETLKCLLICLSEPFFYSVSNHDFPSQSTTEQQEKKPDPRGKWRRFFVGSSTRVSLALFYSLVNVALAYDPVGWGVPYNHWVATDPAEELTSFALHTLSVLVLELPQDFSFTKKSFNIYQRYLSAIYVESELKFIYDAIWRLHTQTASTNSNLLPGSTKEIRTFPQFLMLFFQLMFRNDNFLAFVGRNVSSLKMIPTLIFYLGSSERDLAQLATLIIFLLSTNRNFAISLNSSCPLKIPGVRNFYGSYGDYFILTIVNVLLKDKFKNPSPILLQVLPNLAPFLQNLSVLASMKLMQLFNKMAQPSFLFQFDWAATHVLLVLEAIEKVIQFQFSSNSNFVYTLLYYREHVERFAELQHPSNNNIKIENSNNNIKIENLNNNIKIENSNNPINNLNLHARELPALEKEGESENQEGEDSETEQPQPSSWPAVPSLQWFQRKESYLQSIIQTIQALSQSVEELAATKTKQDILDYLKITSPLGLLPLPSQIVPHKLVPTPNLVEWLSVVALRRLYSVEAPFFFGTSLKLFPVKVLDDDK